WTMLFRGEDSSSSWLLIISSTDSFLRARESRSYVELRSGPVSANCNSPKYQTIVMFFERPQDLCDALFRRFDYVRHHPQEIEALLHPFFLNGCRLIYAHLYRECGPRPQTNRCCLRIRKY